MFGLDTNSVVSYLTQDDSTQSPKAREIIERRLTEENPGFISIVAMVETVWVLERAYELTTHEIVGAVERMLQTDVLVVENEQEVFTALIALKEGQGEFAHAVIAAPGIRSNPKPLLITRDIPTLTDPSPPSGVPLLVGTALAVRVG